ncbi:hypothetical protein VE01_07152 [Pseudogymnoascus verrucosus]|uniref:Uncharacterized protein n=1 Tax=Pseudogymnoascus verrucosus TaxID=342668 RepID=A0A1B8GE02_9PEZI|nr:uncharacterized protein VE01_07152 [Pseudogymnoascus verrucosus]OBT94054.1 hypothetical protein VE01_07152 [Pseudogymnoascus verrucosus]
MHERSAWTKYLLRHPEFDSLGNLPLAPLIPMILTIEAVIPVIPEGGWGDQGTKGTAERKFCIRNDLATITSRKRRHFQGDNPPV